MAKIDLTKDIFNKQIGIGVVVGVAVTAASFLSQNFVPESLDTQKKYRKIFMPLIVGVLSVILIPKKEYKPFAVLGAALMLIFGILKLMDEEKEKDKRILAKMFGLEMMGDRREIEFNSVDEAKAFLNAATQINGEDYFPAQVPDRSVDQSSSGGLYGDGRIESESGLSGDNDDLFGGDDEESLVSGMV